jgi:hypothetical protein
MACCGLRDSALFVQIALLALTGCVPVITLVGGDADQPSLQGFGIAYAGEFVEQIQTDRLEDVGRILGGAP